MHKFPTNPSKPSQEMSREVAQQQLRQRSYKLHFNETDPLLRAIYDAQLALELAIEDLKLARNKLADQVADIQRAKLRTIK